MPLKAPFTGAPRDLSKTRAAPRRHPVLRKRAAWRWSSRFRARPPLDARVPDRPRRRPAEPPTIWSRNSQDRYRDPGTPLDAPASERPRAIVLQDGDFIFLAARARRPKGDRPFLDRFNLKTLEAERLFQLGERRLRERRRSCSTPTAGEAPDAPREPTEPPNYFVRDLRGRRRRAAHRASPTRSRSFARSRSSS